MRFTVNFNDFISDFEEDFNMNKVAIEAAKQAAIDKWPELGSAENRRKLTPERKKEVFNFLVNEFNKF